MCGIAGIISIDNSELENSDSLNRMLSITKHRGPDDTSLLVNKNFQIGMNRLSIIDLETGNQPIYNSSKNICIFFNGEIYNYIEIKNELLKLNHKFYTNGDTEVILHLYEEIGIKFVEKLNGMFSFVILDFRFNKFYIVRDRFGIKPLYYAQIGNKLIFCSELKGILNSNLLKVTLNYSSIIDYLFYHYIPNPSSIFNEIKKLEPGSYIEINSNKISFTKWYDIHRFYNFDSNKISIDDYSENLRILLNDSVKIEMRSDVPVGCFLSGGIDSSLLVALASRYTSLPINTFSVGFENSEFDELPYAKLISDEFNTNHHVLQVSSIDALDNLKDIMWSLDEPIGDSAVLPVYLISKYASNFVKVSLSGLGGDELFGGYLRYKKIKSRFNYFRYFPMSVLKLISPILNSIIPNASDKINLLKNKSDLYQNHILQMSDEMLFSFLGKSIADFDYIFKVKTIYDSYKGKDELNQRMFTDINSYMTDQLLHLTDRCSMAVSLETRVPFLDHRLVELSLHMPSSFKIKKNFTKFILYNTYKNLIPSSVFFREKWGFASPHKSWLSSDKMSELICILLNGNLINDGILDRKFTSDFFLNQKKYKRYPTWVWPLLVFEIWYTNNKKYIK